jgi:hypothetical protein
VVPLLDAPVYAWSRRLYHIFEQASARQAQTGRLNAALQPCPLLLAFASRLNTSRFCDLGPHCPLSGSRERLIAQRRRLKGRQSWTSNLYEAKVGDFMARAACSGQLTEGAAELQRDVASGAHPPQKCASGALLTTIAAILFCASAV